MVSIDVHDVHGRELGTYRSPRVPQAADHVALPNGQVCRVRTTGWSMSSHAGTGRPYVTVVAAEMPEVVRLESCE